MSQLCHTLLRRLEGRGSAPHTNYFFIFKEKKEKEKKKNKKKEKEKKRNKFALRRVLSPYTKQRLLNHASLPAGQCIKNLKIFCSKVSRNIIIKKCEWPKAYNPPVYCRIRSRCTAASASRTSRTTCHFLLLLFARVFSTSDSFGVILFSLLSSRAGSEPQDLVYRWVFAYMCLHV